MLRTVTLPLHLTTIQGFVYFDMRRISDPPRRARKTPLSAEKTPDLARTGQTFTRVYHVLLAVRVGHKEPLSIQDLMKLTGRCRMSVISALRTLATAGLLTRVPPEQRGRGYRALYALRFH